MSYGKSIFINCPFDPGYASLLRAIVFVVQHCGAMARCELEEDQEGGIIRIASSDLAGYDVSVHNDEPGKAIHRIRDWLQDASPDTMLPGGKAILERFQLFSDDLQIICRGLHLVPDELTFPDLSNVIEIWLSNNPLGGADTE